MFTFNFMARTALAPLMVPMEQGLGIGHTQATSLLLYQAIGFSSAQFLCGFLLSRVIPYKVVAFSVIATGLCLITIFFITTFLQATCLFLVFGLAAGLYFPASMATLSTLVAPQDWGKAVAAHELAPNTCFIILPILAQFALLHTDWRGVFGILGVAITIGGVAFFCWGRGGRSYAAPPSFNGCKEYFSNRITWIFMMLLAIGITGEFATFSVLPAHLIAEVGLSPERANHLVSMSRILSPFAAIAGGWAADKISSLLIIRSYLVLQGGALWLMASTSLSIAMVSITMQAALTAFSFPAMFKLLAMSFPAKKQPLIISLTIPVASFTGTGIIPSFLGYCGDTISFAFGFSVLAAVSALCVLPLFGVENYLAQHQERETM